MVAFSGALEELCTRSKMLSDSFARFSGSSPSHAKAVELSLTWKSCLYIFASASRIWSRWLRWRQGADENVPALVPPKWREAAAILLCGCGGSQGCGGVAWLLQ